MITSITGSNHLIVSGMSSSYVSNSGNHLCVGQMRYNTVGNNVEVFDGTSWVIIGGHATVELSSYAASAIEWAAKKQREEEELDKLCNEHPALSKARNRFELLKRIINSEQRSSPIP